MWWQTCPSKLTEKTKVAFECAAECAVFPLVCKLEVVEPAQESFRCGLIKLCHEILLDIPPSKLLPPLKNHVFSIIKGFYRTLFLVRESHEFGGKWQFWSNYMEYGIEMELIYGISNIYIYHSISKR